MKVAMGMSPQADKLEQLQVCVSMPLAQASTITAESTAVSVR